MRENTCTEEKAMDLLNQLEFILESDPFIDEVGFMHPSQFVTLSEGADILLPLFGAAKEAFGAAIRQYKTFTSLSGKLEGQNISCCSSPCVSLESEVMKHSRSILLLSCDFGTAWNSRKLIVSKKQQLLMFINELLLSQLVLSYSPKSERAWTYWWWVIKMIAGKRLTLEDIIAKESELVEKIAERSKMNYCAWNHRCWLVSYMTRAQMLHELKKSRVWAGLHVADNSCFHYHRRLMVGILKNCYKQEKENSCNIDHYQILEELDWNELVIKRSMGREALWLHHRFLSLHWIRHLTSNLCGAPYHSEQKLCSCSILPPIVDKANSSALIKRTCPDKSSLWDCLF
ncbi:hypothetical protein SLA2020_313440 [Shorea laevis]